MSTSPNSTSALPAEAQQNLDRGLAAARQEDWSSAIRYFEDATKTAPLAPAVLFNLALADSKVPGRELSSIAYFHQYICEALNAKNAKEVQAQIFELEAKVEANIAKILRLSETSVLLLAPGSDRDDILCALAGTNAASGYVEEGQRLFSLMTNNPINSPSLCAFYFSKALAQSRRGDFLATRETIASSPLEGWQELVWDESDDAAKARKAKALAKQQSEYYRVNALEQAKWDLGEALQTASRTQLPSEEYSKIYEIVQIKSLGKARQGNFAAAIELASQIRDADIRSKALEAIEKEKSYHSGANTTADRPSCRDYTYFEHMSPLDSDKGWLNAEILGAVNPRPWSGKGSQVPDPGRDEMWRDFDGVDLLYKNLPAYLQLTEGKPPKYALKLLEIAARTLTVKLQYMKELDAGITF